MAKRTEDDKLAQLSLTRCGCLTSAPALSETCDFALEVLTLTCSKLEWHDPYTTAWPGDNASMSLPFSCLKIALLLSDHQELTKTDKARSTGLAQLTPDIDNVDAMQACS